MPDFEADFGWGDRVDYDRVEYDDLPPRSPLARQAMTGFADTGFLSAAESDAVHAVLFPSEAPVAQANLDPEFDKILTEKSLTRAALNGGILEGSRN